MCDTSTNSFNDIAVANQRGGLANFSHTATDWNAGYRAAYLEMGDGVSETRSNNWAAGHNKLDSKYTRDDSSIPRQHAQPFSN